MLCSEFAYWASLTAFRWPAAAALGCAAAITAAIGTAALPGATSEGVRAIQLQCSAAALLGLLVQSKPVHGTPVSIRSLSHHTRFIGSTHSRTSDAGDSNAESATELMRDQAATHHDETFGNSQPAAAAPADQSKQGQPDTPAVCDSGPRTSGPQVKAAARACSPAVSSESNVALAVRMQAYQQEQLRSTLRRQQQPPAACSDAARSKAPGECRKPSLAALLPRSNGAGKISGYNWLRSGTFGSWVVRQQVEVIIIYDVMVQLA